MLSSQQLVLINTSLVIWYMSWPFWPSPSTLIWFSRISSPLGITQIWSLAMHNGATPLTILWNFTNWVRLTRWNLTKAYSEWASLCTPTWLMHTWQYASEHGWSIATGFPSLPLKQWSISDGGFLVKRVSRRPACHNKSLLIMVTNIDCCQYNWWTWHQSFIIHPHWQLPTFLPYSKLMASTSTPNPISLCIVARGPYNLSHI